MTEGAGCPPGTVPERVQPAAPPDLRSPAMVADPYPAYAAQRAAAPVVRVPSAGLWLVLDHAGCGRVLHEPAFSAAGGQLMRSRRTALPVSMLTADPPEHGRLRQDLAPVLAPAAVRRRGPALRALVAAHVDRLAAVPRDVGQVVDLVVELARPLAAAVVADVVGLGPGGADLVRRHGPAASWHLDPFAAEDGAALDAVSAVLEVAADLLNARAGSGSDPSDGSDGAAGPDAVGALAAAWREDRLSPGECLSAVALLVVGGFEPLADALVAVVLAASAAAPAGDDDAARRLVEEVLRHDPPIQFTARRATRPVRLGGHEVAAGDGVVAVLGAANRDPARFAAPDAVDPYRSPNPHLAFGAGPHTCLGAALVRTVLVLTVERLWESGVAVEPAGAAERRAAVVPRGFSSYPVRVRSRTT